MEIEKIKQIGIRSAFRGGEILKSHFGNLKSVHKKGVIDLVTEADIQSERAIVDTIRSAFPDHGILAEETGSIEGSPEARWVIDPLDGTTNFTHGLSVFAISIAFCHYNKPVFGTVFNPSTGELFTAIEGQGASLNDRPIAVSGTKSVRDSLLVTGFPYNLERISGPLERFGKCLPAAQGIRRLGSAALDLCFMACGRFDGFWEEYLNPWDTAAGLIIALEAGGMITDFQGQPFSIENKQILATNGRIHTEMIKLLNIEESK